MSLPSRMESEWFSLVYVCVFVFLCECACLFVCLLVFLFECACLCMHACVHKCAFL